MGLKARCEMKQYRGIPDALPDPVNALTPLKFKTNAIGRECFQSALVIFGQLKTEKVAGFHPHSQIGRDDAAILFLQFEPTIGKPGNAFECREMAGVDHQLATSIVPLEVESFIAIKQGTEAFVIDIIIDNQNPP